jgi:hypothetical protein
MTADLGKYFNAPYSWEWARDYIRESCISDWEFEGTDFMAFLDGQYNLNKKLINSPANHGIFFADSDSMVTRMYAEYYAKDESCALTQEEFEKIAVMADVGLCDYKNDILPKSESVIDMIRVATYVHQMPAAIDMIEDCKAGKIDLIITKSVSRFSRNIMDCIGYVRELKALKHPVGVYFETESINTLALGVFTDAWMARKPQELIKSTKNPITRIWKKTLTHSSTE